ncbi:helix-turn-helix domain-containing protein [Parashewanella curva]|uniref:helix-turn-helix domain-containing protein n=1 Tax=Parashewanella curva TaxID=2338552 RepID=UPI001404B0C1|nr:helix-turn-helix domain-containing protein [Parashewanella curva]
MNESIGQRIKTARIALGYSQEQLGKMLGVVFQSVQQWESGKTTPRNHRLVDLANSLNVSASWLQFGEIQQVEQCKTTPEIEALSKSSFKKIILNAEELNWLTIRKDMNIEMLADLFYQDLKKEITQDRNQKR